MLEDFVWTEKYRPKTISETILPTKIKSLFQQFVDKKEIPNLLLTGTPGVGKTTVARALLEELGCDYMVINGSMEGNIDTLRNKIKSFASTVSLSGGKKYVILDEADYLNASSTQPALRNFIEEFSKNCGFILTCNYKNRIIEPLQSRCSTIEFKISKEDKTDMMVATFKRILTILKAEKIEFVQEAVLEVVKKFFPDLRKILNELQTYSATGKIDSGIIANFADVSINNLVGFMKSKDFTNVRKWVAENSDMEPTVFYRKLYDSASTFCTPMGVAQLVLIIGKYAYQAAFVVDNEINTAACCVEIMANVEFKK